jgi:hypothetical protein
VSEQEQGIPLADLIEAVRDEMEEAAARARHRRLQFEVQDLQLEVEVATTGTKGVDGGLKLWVLTAGAKASRENAATQKVSIKLSAVSPDGSRFRVSDLASRPVPDE